MSNAANDTNELIETEESLTAEPEASLKSTEDPPCEAESSGTESFTEAALPEAEESAGTSEASINTEESTESDDKSAEPSEESEKSTEESASTPEKPKKRLGKGGLAAIILSVIVIASAAALLFYSIAAASKDAVTELGEPAALPHISESAFLAPLCEIHTDLSEIDTSVPGEHSVKLTLLGFIPIDLSLSVQDTLPPVLELRDLRIMSGITLDVRDFVVSVTDKSQYEISFEAPPDTVNGGTVRIVCTDESNNTTIGEAELISDVRLSDFSFEYGTDNEIITEKILNAAEFDSLTPDIDSTVCGTARITGILDGMTCIFEVIILDTVPPTGVPHSVDATLGSPPDISELVTDITDSSEVRAYYLTEPQYTVGQHTVTVRLEDSEGNFTDYTVKVNIHDIADKYSFEIGAATDNLLSHLNSRVNLHNGYPRIPDSLVIDGLPAGIYHMNLIGEYNPIPFDVEIKDTDPPEITVQEISTYIGVLPEASAFIVTCDDQSDVMFYYKSQPDVSALGNFSVTVIAEDASGNRSTASAVLRVVRDNKPPVIYGVKDLSAYEGDTLSYRNGVYAMDDREGKLTVKADATKVKTSVPGVYTVTYTATDSSGNTASATAKVTIKAISTAAVNEIADQVLSGIITSSMTQRQKARAIYDWCRTNLKYSTATSHLMGSFAKAAYSGFKLHYGNCYTYYAVASSLLTRAGITNIEIQRNDPNNPHYWNLVNIGGSWYHFDTCPQPSPHKLEVFLLTDRQLAGFTKAGYYSFDSSKYPDTP